VGDVRSVTIERDETTGNSIGIGHVEMANDQQAKDGIDRFNGQATQGKVLAVREDKPHIPKFRKPVESAAKKTRAANQKRR
jgi:RNA recognition motif-containing protein